MRSDSAPNPRVIFKLRRVLAPNLYDLFLHHERTTRKESTHNVALNQLSHIRHNPPQGIRTDFPSRPKIISQRPRPDTRKSDVCWLRPLLVSPRLPTRQSCCAVDSYSLWMLISSAENTVVPAKGKALIATDLSIACPPGTYGRVAPRSGLGTIWTRTQLMISGEEFY